MVHSGKRGRKIVAVLQFKFDESFDHQIMVVGGWIATELEWKRLEGSWQRYVDDENERSEPNQQITRFHATEMNCKDGEFKHWDHRKCIRFSRKLINTLAKREMGAIATGCNMEAIQQIWPNGDKKTLQRRTYVLCIKQAMVDLAHIMEENFPGDRVLVVHDHGSWDVAALAGYNLMVGDPKWKYRHLFEGIVSKTGNDPSAVGLQAADMIAYEVFKGIKAKTVSKDAGMRAVMQEFINRDVPMRARWINLRAAQALYRAMKDSGRYPNLDELGVA
jgi:hypothetical protein